MIKTPDASVVFVNSLGLSSYDDASIVVVDSSSPLLHRRHFRCCHQSLRFIRHVVSSPSSTDTSVVVANPSDPSFLADSSVIIVNPSSLSLRNQRLLCRCRSLRRIVASSSSANESVDVLDSSGPSSSDAASAVVVNFLGPPLRRCRLCHRCQSLKRVVSSSSSTGASVVVVDTLGSSSSADASVAVVNSLGPSSRLRSLCHQRQPLVRVIYSSFFTNASVIIAKSSGPSSSAYASVVVINSLSLLSPRCYLCRCCQSFGRIVSSSSLADASFVGVNSYGPSSSA